MIQSLSIKNFKACKNIQLNNLGKVNYLVGKNKSGKSSIMQAIYYDILENNIKTERSQSLKDIKFQEYCHTDTKIQINFTSGDYRTHLPIFVSHESEILKDLYYDKPSESGLIYDLEDSIYWSLHRSKYLEFSSLQYMQTYSYEDGGYGYHQGHGFLGEILEFLQSENNLNSDIVDVIHEKKLYQSIHTSSGEKSIYSLIRLLSKLDNYDNIYHKSRQGYTSGLLIDMNLIVCIEEPETNHHPDWQKKIPELLDKQIQLFEQISAERESKINLQFFITTHSPFVIRRALDYQNHKVFHLEDGMCLAKFDQQKIQNEGVISFDNVLKDLGFQMKDVYYPNCLIYVEGVTDLLYIQYWLDLYQVDLEKKFRRGLDYEFVEYGGVLASHLIINPEMKVKADKMNLLLKNRNIFFITDNDSIASGGKGSNFENAKKRIANEISEVSQKGYKAKFFKFEDIDQVTTIESLIDEGENSSSIYPSNTKLKRVCKNIEFWKKEGKTFDGFIHNEKIMKLIKPIYEFIYECNH